MTAATNRAAPGRTPRPGRLLLTISASPSAVRDGLVQLRDFLRAAHLSADACGTAEIVLAEALNNVAEHAYPADKPGRIQIEAGLAETQLIVDIIDEGAPLPGLRLPPRCSPQIDKPKAEMPEGGFGWFMIHSLTTSLGYWRRDERNHLHLVLDVTSQD
ncbi:ATP-binding protein [Roseovarius sp. S4756]|uniref:ATP-binding protein n=1 Tax=Roseovarius maritimus TaxID=3342637 RepID=UPI003726AEAB